MDRSGRGQTFSVSVCYRQCPGYPIAPAACACTACHNCRASFGGSAPTEATKRRHAAAACRASIIRSLSEEYRTFPADTQTDVNDPYRTSTAPATAFPGTALRTRCARSKGGTLTDSVEVCDTHPAWSKWCQTGDKDACFCSVTRKRSRNFRNEYKRSGAQSVR
jgi:hypothetical protein